MGNPLTLTASGKGNPIIPNGSGTTFASSPRLWGNSDTDLFCVGDGRKGVGASSENIAGNGGVSVNPGP